MGVARHQDHPGDLGVADEVEEPVALMKVRGPGVAALALVLAPAAAGDQHLEDGSAGFELLGEPRVLAGAEHGLFRGVQVLARVAVPSVVDDEELDLAPGGGVEDPLDVGQPEGRIRPVFQEDLVGALFDRVGPIVVVEPVIVVVPNRQIRGVVDQRLQTPNLALSAVLLAQDVRVEGVAIDVVADPEEDIRFVVDHPRPDRLDAIVLPLGARAEGDPQVGRLPRRWRGLEPQWFEVLEVTVLDAVDPELIKILGRGLEVRDGDHRGVVVGLFGHHRVGLLRRAEVRSHVVDDGHRERAARPDPDPGVGVGHGADHGSLHQPGVSGVARFGGHRSR